MKYAILTHLTIAVSYILFATTASADILWDFDDARPDGSLLPLGWSQEQYEGVNGNNEPLEKVLWEARGKLRLQYRQDDPKSFQGHVQTPALRFTDNTITVSMNLSAAYDSDDELYMVFVDPDSDPGARGINVFNKSDDIRLDNGLTGFDGDFVETIDTPPDGVFTLRIGAGDYNTDKTYSHVEIENLKITGAILILPGDFDSDGDLDGSDIDALSQEVRLGTNTVTFDLNADGRVNTDDRRSWVIDLKRTYFGDSNLDGEFGSGDLVQVFQAGRYRDDVDRNGNWESGDWNGDGDFDTSDFIFAFQQGGYETGPRSVPVPEPASATLLLVLCLMTVPVRRSAL
jgi:hypothetical protein